jgi:hypothetical protein
MMTYFLVDSPLDSEVATEDPNIECYHGVTVVLTNHGNRTDVHRSIVA